MLRRDRIVEVLAVVIALILIVLLLSGCQNKPREVNGYVFGTVRFHSWIGPDQSLMYWYHTNTPDNVSIIGTDANPGGLPAALRSGIRAFGFYQGMKSADFGDTSSTTINGGSGATTINNSPTISGGDNTFNDAAPGNR